MRKRKILAAVLSVFGVLTLVLAACAPPATPTPAATPTPPPIVATPTPVVAAPTPTSGVATPTPTPAPVVATPTPLAGMPVGYGFSPFGEWGMPLNLPPPVYGGVFRESGNAPPHFDSHRTYSNSIANPISFTMDGLVRFSPFLDIDIIPATYDVEYLGSSLAEKWEVSQDGLTVTFYLKKGVTWHDGKPFTAKDVGYSLNKMLDPKRSVWTADLAMVDRVEMVDDYTIKVHLKFPATRYLLLLLGTAQLSIQPEHLKDVSYRTKEFMVGTGPFKLKSITPGIEMIWEKNPNYHFKGRPYVDGIKWFELANNVVRAESLAAGQLDYANLWGGGEQEVEILKKVAPEVKVRFIPKIGVTTNVWQSFIRERPWQDVRVRKAAVMVLDFKELCVAVVGKLADQLCNHRTGYLLSAPVGKGLPFEEYEKAWWLNRPLAERVAEAKRLLAEAGYPAGFKAEFFTSSTFLPSLLVMFDTWKKLLNIQTDMKTVPAAQELDLIQRGDFDFYSRSSISWSGATEGLVNGNFIKGGSTNYSFYYHPKVEELYVELLKERDANKALKIFHQIERLLIDDVPLIPMYGLTNIHGEWPYIKPRMFTHPVWTTQKNGTFTVIWLDKNDPTYAKRAK